MRLILHFKLNYSFFVAVVVILSIHFFLLSIFCCFKFNMEIGDCFVKIAAGFTGIKECDKIQCIELGLSLN